MIHWEENTTVASLIGNKYYSNKNRQNLLSYEKFCLFLIKKPKIFFTKIAIASWTPRGKSGVNKTLVTDGAAGSVRERGCRSRQAA